ncbi:MAG: hypothetical protein LBL66_09420 [Clostridiales bacterium]|nr:hypothetical protein [Clostridiales bacterium]
MKGKRTVCFLIALFLMFALLACTDGVPPGELPGETTERVKTVVGAIDDPKFENGFNLRGLNNATDAGVVKVVNFGDAGTIPQWNIAQWWSKHNLKDGAESVTESDYILSDASKTVTLKRKYGAISLGVRGSEEFASFNGVPPPAWPHLLIEQSLKDGMWLKDADEVAASLDFTLTKSENMRGGNLGFNAQFAWFIYVADQNPQSAGFGNFLWFGLNIYDSMKVYAPPVARQDTAGGPGNYIFSVGAESFLSARVRVGQNNRFSYDILPDIKAALAKARENGFMTGTDWRDCRLTGTNIGWEVFDRWDVDITLFSIGIDLIRYS